MATSRWRRLAALLLLLALAASNAAFAADGPTPAGGGFPPALDSYGDPDAASLTAVLKNRVAKQPFNLVATLLFLGAIVHTFLTHKFRHYSHVLEERHQARIRGTGRTAAAKGYEGAKDDVSFGAAVFHFLGEVEAVFGLWVVPLLIAMFIELGSRVMLDYVNHRAGYNEPIFVVIIMAMSATRPVLRLAENLMRHVSGLGGGGPAAWWMTILTLGPLLGSFITEPAAMTISASLLGVQFYRLKPSPKFAYTTLGLLFVNVSVGGTLTHFAAPPVLMVAGRWNWDLAFMFQHFGWQAALGIVAANLAGLAAFRKELAALAAQAAAEGAPRNGLQESIPVWVSASHLLFMSWSVLNAHYPAMLIGGFLFFLAFHQATEQYQHRMELRSPILVGFFLAGLVVHGGLQGWWIEPVLRRLNEFPLFVGAAGLTAFNDNAAITYLATLVPGLTDGMKHAIVAGAVVGGGLTVIANAPNPAGQAILGRYFKEGISPLGLLLGALVPTLVVGTTMWLLR